MPHVFTVNCTGPDGSEHKAGDPVPAKWPKAVVADLVKTGGAKATTARAKKAAK